MITNPEEIQSIIDSMESEISANEVYISALITFSDCARAFDGKVINKRFTNALKESMNNQLTVYDFKYTYRNDGIDFPVYQRNRYSDNYSKYFRFPVDKCFKETDSGKLRINAKGFSERCSDIRQDLANSNAIIRSEIDSVYQM